MHLVDELSTNNRPKSYMVKMYDKYATIFWRSKGQNLQENLGLAGPLHSRLGPSCATVTGSPVPKRGPDSLGPDQTAVRISPV